METKIKPKHNITLESRSHALVTGVDKVVDASAKCITLSTSDGVCHIYGEGLQISAYSESDGTLTFGGRVDRWEYAAAKKPLLKRIFK